MYSALPVYMLCYMIYVHVFMHSNHLIAVCAQASYLGKTLDIPSLHQKSFKMSWQGRMHHIPQWQGCDAEQWQGLDADQWQGWDDEQWPGRDYEQWPGWDYYWDYEQWPGWAGAVKPRDDWRQEWEATQGWDVALEWASQGWSHCDQDPNYTAAASASEWGARKAAMASRPRRSLSLKF